MGLILKTLGQQIAHLGGLSEKAAIPSFFILIGVAAMKMMGPCIGVAVAKALNAPPLVLFASAVTGYMGATFKGFGITLDGGPAGAFIAVAVGVEFGKMVSKETKVDIIVTPAVVLFTGGLAAKFLGPGIGFLMVELGKAIEDRKSVV